MPARVRARFCWPSEEGSSAWAAVYYWRWHSNQNTTKEQANRDFGLGGMYTVSQPDRGELHGSLPDEHTWWNSEIIKFLLPAQEIRPCGAGMPFFSIPPRPWLPLTVTDCTWLGHQHWSQGLGPNDLRKMTSPHCSQMQNLPDDGYKG